MANTPKPILQSLKGEPSPYGLSNYTREFNCSRKAYLDEIEKEGGRGQNFSAYSSALRGIIGHKFMELFFKRELDETMTVAIEFEETVDEKARFQAERAFTAFRERFPDPKHWGTVVAVEEEVGPSSEVSEVVGILPYTCRFDLVTRLTAHRIKKIQESIECEGKLGEFVPGYWGIDWKFLSRREALLLDKTLGSLPYVAYPLAWNATYPKQPLRGMLQVSIFCTTETRFLLTVVPFPNKEKQAILHNFMAMVVHKIGEDPEKGRANPLACFDWGRACWHYIEGRCKRY